MTRWTDGALLFWKHTTYTNLPYYFSKWVHQSKKQLRHHHDQIRTIKINYDIMYAKIFQNSTWDHPILMRCLFMTSLTLMHSGANLDSCEKKTYVIYRTLETVSYPMSKNREDIWKYNAQRSPFEEFSGCRKCGKTLSQVFSISSQSKLKLKGKRRNKIANIYGN